RGNAEPAPELEEDVAFHGPLQSERAAIQDSTLGQVPLEAPLPAITPMWPPGTRSSSLSGLPTFSISRADWQGGVMWSSSAITFSRLAFSSLRSTFSPRRKSVPFISLLPR